MSQIIESEIEAKGDAEIEIPEGESAVAKLIQEKIIKVSAPSLKFSMCFS